MQQTKQVDFCTEDEQIRHLYRATDCLNNCYRPNTVAKAATYETVKAMVHFFGRS